VELSPDGLFALTAFARACFVQEQYVQAAKSLQEIISQYDVSENYVRDFGFALFRLGQFKEADRVFARMIRDHMLPGFASFMRHHIALQAGRTADARKYLGDAIKAEPTNAEYRDALKQLESAARSP